MGMVAVIQFGLVIASLYDQKFANFKTTNLPHYADHQRRTDLRGVPDQLAVARADNRRRAATG